MIGEPDRNMLVHWVVPSGYVHWTDPEMWVAKPISDDVTMVLAFDNGSIIRNASLREVEALGLSETEAFELALDNTFKSWINGEVGLSLIELPDGTQLGISTGSKRAPAIALLGSTFFELLQDHFGTDHFIAVVPNQDTLIAFPADNATLASRDLRGLVMRMTTGHAKPVSRSWLLMDGNWPRAYPGRSDFDDGSTKAQTFGLTSRWTQ